MTKPQAYCVPTSRLTEDVGRDKDGRSLRMCAEFEQQLYRISFTLTVGLSCKYYM